MRAFTQTVRQIAFSLAMLAASTCGFAAERWAGLADSVFQHLVHDSELPNSALPTAVTQDGDGFLWVGSQNGLARWDGYHFRIFRASPGKPGALPDNIIQTLYTDMHGALWIGTVSGGLARYDREHDRFVVYPAGPKGLSNVSVRAIADDGNGGVWVATEDGLDRIAESGVITHFRHEDGELHGLPDNRVRGLLRDRRGTLWVGMAAGLARLDSLATGFVTVPLPAPEGKLPSAWTFLEDSEGRIWVGTVRHGAYLIDPNSGEAKPVRESDVARSTLQDEGIGAIIEPVPGHLWLGTVGQGIVTIDLSNFHTRRIRHDPTLPASLADDTIQALYKDRSGLIWICTNRSISRFDPAQSAVMTIFGASSLSETISDTNVDSVLSMPDGHVWLGLDSNGIDILDPEGARVGGLRPDPAHPDTALPKDYINAFATAPGGDVFVGTEQGLYRVDPGGHRALRITVPQRDPVAPVWALLREGGFLWIGGSDGLTQVELSDEAAPKLLSHLEASNGLSDERITSIERNGEKFLWVGTKNGLNHINIATHAVERILPDPTNPTALSASYVTSLLTDPRGRLWVATFGGGVNVLESRDERGRPQFRRLGIAQGFVNENANKLLEDVQRKIWVSTDEGLALIDERTFAVRTLRAAEGLPISSYWVGSGAVTREGELLFGGVGGLSIVRPERLMPWSYHPPIAITDIRVGGRPVATGRLGVDEAAAALTIDPAANSVAVEFSALDFSAPERNRYAYRLEGFDSGWVDSEPLRRLAAYTNLPPGEYKLRLRGSNRDGVWTERSLSVPIKVLPAWYQTLAFRVAAVLVGLGIVALLIQARTMYLRRNQRDLERQVVERTAELRESQRQLEQIAYYDTLTALPNRRMFTEEFRELIVLARLQSERFGLLIIDLDRFKQVNDSRGHDAGDALLIEAAIRLQAAVRKSDCVARLGGDEFAVLVGHNPSASDIENICQRIIESWIMPVPLNGAGVKSSASIGVAVFPDHGSTLDNVYKSADVALYEAKRAGGNQYRWFHTHTGSMAGAHPVKIMG